MLLTFLRSLVAAAVLCTVAASAPRAQGQEPSGTLHLLDVPYLPQSEALCGGAAVAMVMRYWNETGVYAETFAHLVDPGAGGIRGEQLLQALESRGWNARSLRGDPELVRTHLDARRPVIALIEDRPSRFHYVVIVGWSNGRVILHDPARAPFRIVDEKSFVAAWTPSGFWTLIATPSSEPRAPGSTPPIGASGTAVDRSALALPSGSPLPCAGMVSEAVRLAGADAEAARRLLELAADTCPQFAAPWREMAGLHALRGDWTSAAQDAKRALTRDRDDHHAWRILATSLYLEQDPEGALHAWNHVGEPRIELIDVGGLERTRHSVASRAMALEPQTILSQESLQLARRRLSELPAALVTRVSYRPQSDGRAEIAAVVIERPLLPTTPLSLAATGLRAAIDREVVVGVASPSGGGELWTAAWRWWEHRPRVSIGFSAPAPFGGTWGVEAFDERQTYAAGSSVIEESRRSARFHVGNWKRSDIRWRADAGVTRWRGRGRAVSLGIDAQQYFAADRGLVEARISAYAGGVRTGAGAVRSEWRSSVRHEADVWIARAGLDIAGSGAPLALWPGAGTGQARDVLLRGHPLLDDGIIAGGVFGRRLAHGGVEWRRWFRRKVVRIAPAGFVDAARASRRLDSFEPRWHFDAGAGLRFAVTGTGILRVDVGRGLRDGALALSVGWTR